LELILFYCYTYIYNYTHIWNLLLLLKYCITGKLYIIRCHVESGSVQGFSTRFTKVPLQSGFPAQLAPASNKAVMLLRSSVSPGPMGN